MLDENFMVKIIDFGLAAPVQGRDGSGYLKTALGTYGYMSPELHLGREYSGEKVDVFALGVILFVIFSKHPPFNAATPQDPFYVALASKSYSIFWKKHTEYKPNGDAFFSAEFKDLFERMSELDPDTRITIEEVMKHPWYVKECTINQTDIKEIFSKRFENLNEELSRQSSSAKSAIQRYEAYSSPSES